MEQKNPFKDLKNILLLLLPPGTVLSKSQMKESYRFIFYDVDYDIKNPQLLEALKFLRDLKKQEKIKDVDGFAIHFNKQNDMIAEFFSGYLNAPRRLDRAKLMASLESSIQNNMRAAFVFIPDSQLKHSQNQWLRIKRPKEALDKTVSKANSKKASKSSGKKKKENPNLI